MNQSQLKQEASNAFEKLKDAKLEKFPFGHFYVDNFFSDALIQKCLENFPNSNDSWWERSDDAGIEIKWRSTWESEFDIPEGIVDAVRIMNSSYFLRALSKKLGIPKLVPDPYFSGWGLNETQKNGLLDIHIDGNYHDASGLNRRVNVILYLNPDWNETWGGEFEVWDNKWENCINKIAPKCNRIVVFDTHDYSYHGSPNPLNCPKDDSRKSIILYYYTKQPRPSKQIEIEKPHSALWKKKGFLDKRWNKTRNYN